MEFGIQMYVFEFWKYDWFELDMDTVSKMDRSQIIPESIGDCLWSPDTIFPNGKRYDWFITTVKNMRMRILPNGYIKRCSRLMSSFPYYFLLLMLKVSVTVSTFTKVKLSWVEDANDSIIAAYKPNIDVNHGVKPMQFSMKPPVGLTYFRELPTATILRYLVCQFTFERHVVSSVLNTYIPSFLVVCLSFVSFWLDVNAVPGRVTLGVTAILTLTTQIVHARNSLPHVEYLTAVDFWLFGCLTLVFLSLIEFTVTQSIARNSEITKNTGWTDSFVRVGKRDFPKRRAKPTNLQKIRLNAYQNNILDLISRAVFPIILVVFTVLYWAIFAQYV